MTTELKLGRRPPKNHPAIKLADIRSHMPVVPPSEDWLGSTGWSMLGNDQYGDCVAVTWANIRRVLGADYPGMSEVIQLYKTQNPGFPQEDYGMDIQTLLEFLVKSGGPDGVKALAFAKVDHTNVAEVKAAIAIFGFMWTGITVQDANMRDFSNNKPWDYHPQARDDGGHSVVTGGFGPAGLGAGRLSGDERFITWAQETSFTDAYWKEKVDEAWVVIFPEHLDSQGFLLGVDQVALADSYKELTGRDFPLDPTPAPSPSSAPDPADAALVIAQINWEVHEDNMKRMRTCDKQLEQAHYAWRKAKGL